MICWWILLFSGVFVYFRYFYEDDFYDSHEEVLELFEANTEDFENMVKLLEETNVIGKLEKRWYLCEENFFQPSGNCLTNPLSQLNNSGFVTKAQLKELVTFFKKYRVENIDSHSFGGYDVKDYTFFFWANTYNVYIIYIDSEEDMSEEIMKRHDYIKSASRISEQWYFALIE